MLTTLLIVLLVLALIGGLPQFGWHDRGYGLSGGVGLVLVVLLVMVLVRGGL